MSVVNLTIRNNVYQIACDNGQEAHLEAIASKLNTRLNMLATALGKGNDSLLLVMVGLMMEDEIAELKKTMNRLQEKHVQEVDSAVAAAVDNIATYVETVAKNLENY